MTQKVDVVARQEGLYHYLIETLVKKQWPEHLVREIFEKINKADGIEWSNDWWNEEWKRAVESQTSEGNRHISTEVKDFVRIVRMEGGNSGVVSFTSAECQNRLSIKSKAEKDALYQTLTRLVKDGFLKRTSKGSYEIINQDLQRIDFVKAKRGVMDIRWPFEIERIVHIMPKNIVVVAGEPDAGKTAFLLNFALLNQDKYEEHYFSSEMGDMEMKARLSKFDVPLESWKFHVWERSDNFAEVIKPTAINIIDFLEVHTDFYLVGQWIKEIFDKLTTGIAVIALQKVGKSDVGRGGIGTMEKPRLYLAMSRGEYNEIKIVKGKNWADEMKNPNGLVRRFKLVKGSTFLPLGEWSK